jgi:hypothetical protein
MWELAICFDLEYEKIVAEIKKKLQKAFVADKLICATQKEQNEIKLLLACTIERKYKLSRLLDEYLSDFFVNEYKEKYLKTHLKLNKINDSEEEIFIKALTCFDLEYDKMMVKQKLNYDNTLYLKSFFASKCKAMRQKWLDICELTNENASFLQTEHIFLELLKFLIENLKIHKNVVICYYQNNKLKFVDEHNKTVKIKQNKNSKEVELIRTLIALNPKHIALHYDESMNQDTLQLLKAMFDSRLQLHQTKKNGSK